MGQTDVTINKVPAGHGWLWLKMALDLFMLSPLNWLAMCITLSIATLVIGMIPIASMLLQIAFPGFIAGLMLAADTLHRGQPIHLGYLTEGFKQEKTELLMLGLFGFFGNVLIIALASVMIMVFADKTMIDMLQNYQLGTIPPPEILSALLLYSLLLATISIPLLMALWFAPALIILHKFKARDAMLSSFSACSRNMAAFTLYGGVALIFCFLAVIPFGLGLILLVPVTFISIYTGYRDIFPAT